MKRGSCPKCNSSEVRKLDVLLRGYRDYLQIGGLRSAALDNYLCTSCGYTESYVRDEDLLADVAKRYERVKGSQS
jgi:predicted nucleic-acid-binding Zn-ribbon protein